MHCNGALSQASVYHTYIQAQLLYMCNLVLCGCAAPVSRSIARMATHGSRASVRSSVRGSQANTSRVPRRHRDGRPDNRVRRLPRWALLLVGCEDSCICLHSLLRALLSKLPAPMPAPAHGVPPLLSCTLLAAGDSSQSV